MLLQQLTERIFFMKNQEETDRPVLGYVQGDCAALMIDAGNSPAHVALFQAGLQERSLPDPDWVGITHWHWDHCYGLSAFANHSVVEGDAKGDAEGDAKGDAEGDAKGDAKGDVKGDAEGDAKGDAECVAERDAKGDAEGVAERDGERYGEKAAERGGRRRTFSIACRLTNEALARMSRWTWDDTAMQRRLQTGEDIAFCDEHMRKEYPDRSKIHVCTADCIFEDWLSVDLGGITCNLIRVGGSHSDDSVVVHVPEERVVFVGDAISPDLHHGPAKYDRILLAALIDRLEQLDFTTCVPGHDDPWSRDEVFAYLREELASI